MRKLNIDRLILEDAIQSKASLEALAFAVSIKLNYVSSHVKKSTTLYLKNSFKAGQTKLHRAYKNALNLSYVRTKGNDIVANKLYSSFTHLSIELEKGLSLSQIETELRLLALAHHIQKQNKVNSLQKKTRSPRHSKELRAVKNRLKKWNCTEEVFDGLSYARIANLLSISKCKAIELIQELIDRQKITKKCVKELIYSGAGAKNLFLTHFRDVRGYFLIADKIYLQKSNLYTCL